LLAFSIFSRSLAALVDRLEILEAELGSDRLDVGDRIDPILDVHDVGIVEAPNHVEDRFDLADVGEKLVAEPFTLRGAANEPGDVHEANGRGHDLRGREEFDQRVEALVGDGHHADVRLDRAERIVLRVGLGAGECVKKGTLADVGKSDDAARETHGRARTTRGARRLAPAICRS